ncbi:MAG: nidogen-like domain-containing protein, partial [Acidobacteriota bacterium]
MTSPSIYVFARPALLLAAIAGVICASEVTAQAQATTTAASSVRTNPAFNTTAIARNDDGSSALVSLGFTINLFGKIRTAAYVNNNGNLTFDSALSTFTPFGLKKTAREIIAPFFADVDTRPAGSKQVFFGLDTINGHRAFGANYIDVGYYSQHVDKTNSFQVVLIEREDQHPGDFDIEFNYQRISWETGDASGGINGFGGTPATAGWSNGTDTSYELPGSLIPGAFLDGGPYSLVRQSLTGAPVRTPGVTQGSSGRLIFRARDGVIGPGVTISGGQFSDATVGIPYSAALGVSGATPPYVWTFQSDVADPPGLTLSSGGVLSGTPSVAGTYSFTLGLTANSEDGPITIYQRGSITIQPPTLRISTGCPLSDAYVGSPYSQSFKAVGLANGLIWTLGDTANLPPGVSFNSSGLLAGTPQLPGTYIL